MDLKIRTRAITKLLSTPGVAKHIAAVADEIAEDAAAAVGPYAGEPTPEVTDRDSIVGPAAMVRHDGGKSRARSVIYATHPAAPGRKRAREALMTAAAKSGRG